MRKTFIIERTTSIQYDLENGKHKQYSTYEAGSTVNGQLILERIGKKGYLVQCKCGNIVRKGASSIKASPSCGKCVTKGVLRFHDKSKRENNCHYTHDECEKLLHYWDDVMKFAENPKNKSIQHPVITIKEGHSIMIIEGVIIKERMAKIIVAEKQRILEFIKNI